MWTQKLHNVQYFRLSTVHIRPFARVHWGPHISIVHPMYQSVLILFSFFDFWSHFVVVFFWNFWLQDSETDKFLYQGHWMPLSYEWTTKELIFQPCLIVKLNRVFGWEPQPYYNVTEVTCIHPSNIQYTIYPSNIQYKITIYYNVTEVTCIHPSIKIT